MIGELLFWLDVAAVAVFALTGAIVAARAQLDAVGFVVLGVATGIGGGTIRDAILATPAFWLAYPVDLLCCVGVALVAFLCRAWLHRAEGSDPRCNLLPWADAVGLALFAVTGTERALAAGAHPVSAIILGTITATFGGLVRDVIIGQSTLIARREIYITAALLAGAVYVLAGRLLGDALLPVLAGLAAGFGLRAAAILCRLQLPA